MITQLDEQLFFLINSHHCFPVDQFMFLVSQKLVWVPLYVAMLYAIWRNYSWKGAATVLLLIGAGMLVTDWGNAHLLRPWIGRLRPCNPDNPISDMVHIVNGKRNHGCGFPSAHSANIWLMVFIVSHWLTDRKVRLTLVITALIVCYSRVYLGLHYPGDILGGFVLAWITYNIILWILEMIMPYKVAYPLRHTYVVPVVGALTFIYFSVVALCKMYIP